jgi:hypothetical protein
MSRKGSGAVVPLVGAKVRHPLWPELGVGEVQTSGKAPHPGTCCGHVRWSTGQVSTHNLATLREVED